MCDISIIYYNIFYNIYILSYNTIYSLGVWFQVRGAHRGVADVPPGGQGLAGQEVLPGGPGGHGVGGLGGRTAGLQALIEDVKI